MDKGNLLVKKTILVVITVAILFTAGFVLGAVTAEIKELAPVVEQTTESTTAPTTLPPTTETPTTQAPTTTTTTAPTTETTTTEPSTEATSDTTTTAPSTEEAPAEEPCFLVKIALTVLEFCKTVIDFIISILSSL